jgi:hypothetical protein
VTRAFDDFLVLNPELLDLCGAWQMRTAPRPTVMELFTDFDQRADKVCTALSAALPRFQRYRDRLTTALTRAESGATEYLTDHLDSYHVVWSQLHEDLLVTLGRPRY